MPPALNPTGPPKPRPIQRRISSAANNAASTSSPKTQTAQSSMGPPPVPAPPPPKGILAPEAAALSDCLRSAVVKTAQVYRFYADTKKLGIHRHAPYPPRTLVASLGRDVEKYDQLCDAMQSHLNRAITVLRRDLVREQNRIKAAEAEAAAKAAAAAAPPPSTPPLSPKQEQPDSRAVSPSASKARGPPARRQSTISLSSLSRPAFPHKLDLSSIGFNLNADDPLGLQSGLPSPVTLAPKSSISKVPPDFTFGPDGDVPIDLTLEGAMDDGVGPSMPTDGNIVDGALGSSADKPIELDLDLDMDLFGDGMGTEGQQYNMGDGVSVKTEEPIDLDLFGLTQSTGEDGMKGISDDSKAATQAEGQPHTSSDTANLPPTGPSGQPPPPPENYDFSSLGLFDGDIQLYVGESNPPPNTS